MLLEIQSEQNEKDRPFKGVNFGKKGSNKSEDKPII